MQGDLPSTRTRVTDALGSLRETLGATTNLDQLLRSPRVAPKALSSVLPDVRAACTPVRRDLETALQLLRSRFDANAIDTLGAYLVSQLDALMLALNGIAPSQRGLNASARLSLERVVGQVQRNLAGALPLLELLIEVAYGSRLSLDLHELLVLLRDGDQSHGLRGQTVEAGLESNCEALYLLASPRSALTFIALGAALANEHAATPSLTIGLYRKPTDANTEAKMTIAARAPEVARFKMVIPPVVPPSEACLAAVAHSIGVKMEREAAGVGFRWTETPIV